jgi:hypothetical protein
VAKARRSQFFGHRAAADHIALLQYSDREPRLGEISRRHQSIVASPDDDKVGVHGHDALA